MKLGKRRATPKRASPSLAHVNDAFHEAYDRSSAICEDEAPVFVLFADHLVLHLATGSQKFLAVPAELHLLKSAVHAPVAAFSLLNAASTRRFSPKVIAQLSRLRGLSAASLEKLADASSASLLRDTVIFLDRALIERRVSRRALNHFARSCGKKIGKLVDEAAQLELYCLHASVERALSRLSPPQARKLQVVVAGRHQARDRSLGMQYFQKRFGEKSGRDERVIYAEGASSIAEALAVIGKKRIDRDLARAFFGDAKRMQRDVLGDAAQRILRALPLARARVASSS
jgi:hypothetical protein